MSIPLITCGVSSSEWLVTDEWWMVVKVVDGS